MLVGILGQLIWTDSLGDFYITRCIKIYLQLCKWWTTFSETMPFHPSRGSIGSSCVKCWFLFYFPWSDLQTKYLFVACLDRSKLTSTITSLIKNDKLASKNTERNEWSAPSLILFCEMASQTYINLNVLRACCFKFFLKKMNYTNRSLTKYQLRIIYH